MARTGGRHREYFLERRRQAARPMATITKAANLRELRSSGWVSRPVKREIYDNFIRMLSRGEELFPGIIGYDDTVIPEINLGLIAGHDLLFLGEKGQAKSRLMRLLVRFLDEEIPYLDLPGSPVHEDPYHPITSAGRRLLAETPEEEIPIAWWPRAERYAERLAPGTKFADVIGEIDPAKLARGTSMSAEEALHFGLIPRMHRGVFAVNELPELDELVQLGLFNILEERDVQIRGFPVRFEIDVLILFSANPATIGGWSPRAIMDLVDESVPRWRPEGWHEYRDPLYPCTIRVDGRSRRFRRQAPSAGGVDPGGDTGNNADWHRTWSGGGPAFTVEF